MLASDFRRVNVVATSNVSIATGLSAGQTVDGQSLQAGWLVLLTAQSTATENGVYEVPRAGVAPRQHDFIEYSALAGANFYVMQGTTYADTQWFVSSNPGGVVGQTTIVIEERGSSHGVQAEDVAFTAGGDISSTNVQDALEELDSEKLNISDYISPTGLLAADNTWTGLNSYIHDNTIVSYQSNVNSALGSGMTLAYYRNNNAPAAGDRLTAFTFGGNNDAAAAVQYGQFSFGIASAVAGAHVGRFRVQTAKAGVVSETLLADAGIYTPGATGGDKGIDTLNTKGYYLDGVLYPSPGSLTTSFAAKLAIDGSIAMTGALDVNSHKLLNVTTGTASTDGVNKGQVDTALAAKLAVDGSIVATGDLDLNSHKLLRVSTPALSTDGANKGYVDGLVTGGLGIHPAVAVATTANITLSGEQTIDGVLTSTSRVLVRSQSSTGANGIYVSAAGAWSRATDMDATIEAVGLVPVNGGSTFGNYVFGVSSSPATLGGDPLLFTAVFTPAVGGVSTARQVLAAGAATGGGDLSADRTITVPIAAQADAETGTDNAKVLTSLRGRQQHLKYVPRFDTLAAAALATITADTVLVHGYTAVGDTGSVVTYFFTSSTPSHSAYFTDAGGRKYTRKDKRVKLSEFGGFPGALPAAADQSTMAHTQFNAALAYLHSAEIQGGELVIDKPGTYWIGATCGTDTKISAGSGGPAPLYATYDLTITWAPGCVFRAITTLAVPVVAVWAHTTAFVPDRRYTFNNPQIDCSRGTSVPGANYCTALSANWAWNIEVNGGYLYGGEIPGNANSDSGLTTLGWHTVVNDTWIRGFGDAGIYASGGDAATVNYAPQMLVNNVTIERCANAVTAKRGLLCYIHTGGVVRECTGGIITAAVAPYVIPAQRLEVRGVFFKKIKANAVRFVGTTGCMIGCTVEDFGYAYDGSASATNNAYAIGIEGSLKVDVMGNEVRLKDWPLDQHRAVHLDTATLNAVTIQQGGHHFVGNTYRGLQTYINETAGGTPSRYEAEHLDTFTGPLFNSGFNATSVCSYTIKGDAGRYTRIGSATYSINTTTDNTLPRFDGTTGQLQTSRASVDDNGILVSDASRTASFTLAQNQAASFAVPGGGACLVAFATNVSSAPSLNGIARYQGTTMSNVVMASTVNVVFGAGVLTGSSGGTGNVTVSASGGRIYVENRRAATLIISMSLIAIN